MAWKCISPRFLSSTRKFWVREGEKKRSRNWSVRVKTAKAQRNNFKFLDYKNED